MIARLLDGLVFGFAAGLSIALTVYLLAETDRLWRQWRQRYTLWRERRHSR